MKTLIKHIARVPLSAVLFYAVIWVLSAQGVIGGEQELLGFLSGLFEKWGLIGLGIGAFLEGIAYVGIYFPGSAVVALAVMLSDGSPSTLREISIVVAIALTLSSIINYLIGRYIIARPDSDTPITWWSLIMSMVHPITLSLTTFRLGLRQGPWWYLLLIPVVMVPYGYVLGSLIYSVRDTLFEEMGISTVFRLLVGRLLIESLRGFAIATHKKRRNSN